MTFIYLLSKLFELMNFPAIRYSSLDKSVWIGSGSQVIHSNVDYGTYIGNYVQCLHAEIGKYCSIANNCIIGGAEHPLGFVSTSPVFYGGYKKPFSKKKTQMGSLSWDSYKRKTIIGNDVWMGNNVIIKAGMNIGTGAIIGAGAIVVKDVPPYEIWGGNPAKRIRKRFDEKTIEEMLGSNWWDLDQEKLSEFAAYMDNPCEFLIEIEKQAKKNRGRQQL